MEEAHAGYQRVGDRRLLAWGRADLGRALVVKGDLAAAAGYLQQSVAALRGAGPSVQLLWSLVNLADIAVHEHDHLRALPLYKEALILARELATQLDFAAALAGIAYVAQSLGQSERAARLVGAAETLYRSLEAGGGLLQRGQALQWRARQRSVEEMRRALGGTFDAARHEGASADLDDIIEEALAVEPERRVEAGGRTDQGPLSPREREVATLIAQGFSNREIGRTLLIGHRTVATHVQSILNKLGVDRRSQVAAWATARGLYTPAS